MIQLDPARTSHPELTASEALARHLADWMRTATRVLAQQHVPVEGETCSAWLSPQLGWVREVKALRVREWGSVLVELEDGSQHRTTTANTLPAGRIGQPVCRGGKPCHLHQTLEWESARELAQVLDELPPTLLSQMRTDYVPRSRLWELVDDFYTDRPVSRRFPIVPPCVAGTADGTGAVGLALGSGAAGGPHPYAHHGPIIAKLLGDGIVEGPGRRRRDMLGEAMAAPVKRPEPADPYVEIPRDQPSWRKASRRGQVPVAGLVAAAQQLGLEPGRIHHRIAELPAELRPLVCDDDPDCPWWPSGEALAEWWRDVHRCTRLGVKQVLQCEQGHTGARWLPCSKADCIMCHPRVQRRRGQRLFCSIGGSDLGHLVGTLPPELVDRVGVRQLIQLRTCWRQVVEEWARTWHRVEVGQVIACHPAGDTDPTVFRPHFDSVVMLEARELALGSWETLQRMRSPEELDYLRMLWAGQTLRALRLAGVSAEDRVHHPQLWYGWRDARETGKMLHVLGYMARPFPHWSAGTWPRSISQARRYGLAAPQTTRPGINDWRRRVRGHLERQDVPCFCEGCRSELEVIAVGSWTWVRHTWPQAVDLDELGVRLE